MDVVDRITDLITERNTTAREVENSAGLSNGSIYSWKKGKGKPSLDSICKLSKYFGVTSDYLLCLSDNRNNSIGLSDAEKMLIETFRGCPETEKYKMMHYCMTLQEQKGLSEIAG